MTRRVLILTRGADTAGAGIALKSAFDNHGAGWQARCVRRKNTWLDYPVDIEWRNGNEATGAVVQRLFDAADVIHVMQVPEIVRQFTGWEDKAIVVQHIGSYFRDNPAQVSADCRAVGAVEAPGSHELLRLCPGGSLLVGTMDLDLMAAIRRHHYQPGETVRIAHAPTNPATKSTVAFLEATERLAERHPIEVDLIQGVPWRECLERKARADILFDETRLGYGNNALEAWGMGIPVVCGLEDPEAREMFKADFGTIPWVTASEDTIEDALEFLISDPAGRKHWGKLGRDFAHRVHGQPVVVAQTIALYEQAIAAKAEAVAA